MFDRLELSVEIGNVVESAEKAYLRDVVFRLDEHFAGMADPDLVEKGHKALSGPFFKKTAKGGWSHMKYAGYFFKRDRVGEVIHHILVDAVDAFGITGIDAGSGMR